MILLYLANILCILFGIGFIGWIIYACITKMKASAPIWSAKFFVVESILLGLTISCIAGYEMLKGSSSFMESLVMGLVCLISSVAFVFYSHKQLRTAQKKYIH